MNAPARMPVAQEEPAAETGLAPAGTPSPLLARPIEGPVDLDTLLDDIEARFPKTLARLAE